MTDLDSAMVRNDLQQVEALLKAGAPVDERDREGRTVLMYAALKGREAVLPLLIAAGADVNAQDKSGYTGLHFAAQDYQPGAARVLCEAKARLDSVDRFGNSPLWRAVMNSRGRGEVIRILVEHGADPNQKNKSGVSPRTLAASFAEDDTSQFLPPE